MTSMMEEYENGKEYDEQTIALLFTTAVFFYDGYPFRNNKMTKTFIKYMKENKYNRLLDWAKIKKLKMTIRMIKMHEIYDKKEGIWKKIFTLEEMGIFFPFNDEGNGYIKIDEDFAKKYLFENVSHFHSYFDNYTSNKVIGTDTKIICPFCKKGTIIMVKKKKDICETHVCHTGDNYAFKCSDFSENGCHGIFFYKITWMYC